MWHEDLLQGVLLISLALLSQRVGTSKHCLLCYPRALVQSLVLSAVLEPCCPPGLFFYLLAQVGMPLLASGSLPLQLLQSSELVLQLSSLGKFSPAPLHSQSEAIWHSSLFVLLCRL